ncbi:MAG: flagellar hook protein FlgE [Pseudomonas sp.]|nr:flagellar hook protein FlgE [Pseudomonas sp.]
MSFNTALNGLHASHKRLEVAANNIANVGTHGFKSSRAEFAALYSSSMAGGVRNAVGDGVRLANVSQNFSEGSVHSNSGGLLDMRIQGKGFFVVSDNTGLSYTRAGAFHKDAGDYVVDSHGGRLQGYSIDGKGSIINGVRSDLKIDTSNMAPKITTRITETLNLDASLPSLSTLPVFNPNDPSTYTKVISRTIKDGGAAEVAEVQGKKYGDVQAILVRGRPAIPPADHELKQYFVKTDADQWTMYTLIDGRNPVDHASSSPLQAKIRMRPDGTYSLAGDGKHLGQNAGKEFTLEGWKPAQQVNGIWGASPAANAGPIALTLTEGDVKGVEVNDAILSRHIPSFDPAYEVTFSKRFSTPLFDSLGNQHEITQYFVKEDTNRWRMHVLVNGRNPAAPASTAPLSAAVTFKSDGTLQSISADDGLEVENGILTLKNWTPSRVIDAGKNSERWLSNGARGNDAGIALDMTKITQHNAVTSRVSPQQDGHGAGELNGISVDKNGMVRATFTNGENKNIGQVMLASFANEQGLRPDSNNRWKETSTSGIANMDSPTTGILGGIIGGSLENSNVQLTDELVELIVAQTSYQANSKVLSTEATLMQTLIQAI